MNIFENEIKDNDPINPNHYKEIIPGWQYYQLMKYMLQGWSGDQSHFLGQGYKYLFRLGKKDDILQDLDKGIWYLNKLRDSIAESHKGIKRGY